MRWFLMVDTVLLDVKYNLLLAVQTKLASDKRLEYVVDLYLMKPVFRKRKSVFYVIYLYVL